MSLVAVILGDILVLRNSFMNLTENTQVPGDICLSHKVL